MRINGILNQISQPQGITGLQPSAAASGAPVESGNGFGDTLKDALKNVSDVQSSADDISNKLASGEPVEIHQAMLAMQKASMALQFTVQVRNKVLDAYQEIMRMQV